MQICETNPSDKMRESFKACMDNHDLILLYAALCTGASTAMQEFIESNFPSYASYFYLGLTPEPDDLSVLTTEVQQMLTQQGLISNV